MSFGNDFMKDYGERSREYMDNLDFTTLETIKSKALKDLTDEDLLKVGFKKVNHDEFDDFICYEDLNGLKVYVNRVDDKFELRGYMLRRKEKDIHSTAELLDETLTKWRLKMK
jgi:hypothetical protein